MIRRPPVVALLTLIVAALPVLAAPPTIDSLYPAGAPRGVTAAVTLTGKLEPWPVQVWTDTSALKVEVGKAAGSLKIQVAPDAPIGPHLLRIYNADGASTLRCFIVGEGREIAEVEPNDELAKAQKVDQLPVTINGQLDKVGDVDAYAVSLQAGQRLVASVQGRRLGSAIDPMLHLVDADGNQLAYAQDGLGLDPLLVFDAPGTATYVLRVSAFAFPPVADVKLAGGKDAVYRLSLTTGPFVRAAHPAAVRRGQKATLRAIGWNLPIDHLDVDATAASANVDHLFIPISGAEARLRVDLSDCPELVRGPGAATAPPVTAPVNVSGVVASPGGDKVELSAHKGDRLTLIVHTVPTGSPLDAVLRIEDPAGKLIDSNDDGAGSSDPKLDWTAPADGRYRLVIYDLYGRSGLDFLYRMTIQPPTPEIRATALDDLFALVPGKTVPIKINVARKNGHVAPMVIVATNLPPGVSATSAEVPAKGGEIPVILSAAPDAKPASGPVRLLLLSTDPDHPSATPVPFDLHKDRDKAGNQDLIEATADLWLTLSPTASLTPAKPAP